MTTDINLNTILYGPPGTGKTYNTVNYAVAICEDKSFEDVKRENYSEVLGRFNDLKKKGRIAFTTFHQSYGYEDFIEGIKPITDENGNISYEVKKGVFKDFCEKAELPQDEAINHNAEVYIVRLNVKGNGKDDLKKECFRDGEIRFDWPENYTGDYMKWLSAMKPGDLVASYYDQARYIDGIAMVMDEEPVYDQSKISFRWTRKVKWLIKGKIIDTLEANNGKYLSNFHVGRLPSMKLSSLLELAGGKNTDDMSKFDEAWNKLVKASKENGNQYTFTRRTGSSIAAKYVETDRFRVEWNGMTNTHNDLIKSAVMNQWMDSETNRDQLTGGTRWLYDARQAVLDEMKKYGLPEYKNNNQEPCVFIIDEINRGNISKIFGELITLIEPNKRADAPEATEVKLPYSKDLFHVPSNVYILGTMNTADRSIAIMDTALRRRFDFVEMQPDADVLRRKGADKVDDLDVAAMLERINARIEALYDREHTIGHAFFIELKDDPSIKRLAKIFENKVIPLLQEYFFDDYGKIQLVLGDNKKDEKLKFVVDKDVDANLFKGAEEVTYQPTKYRINKEAFENIESYRQI